MSVAENMFLNRLEDFTSFGFLKRKELVNKIGCVKELRDLADLTLKEAKDLVEAPIGTPLVVFRDGIMAAEAIRRLILLGERNDALGAEAVDYDEAVARRVPRYHRDIPQS